MNLALERWREEIGAYVILPGIVSSRPAWAT